MVSTLPMGTVAPSASGGVLWICHAPITQLDRVLASEARCGRSSRPRGVSCRSTPGVRCVIASHSPSRARRRRGNLMALCLPPAALGLPRRLPEADSSQMTREGLQPVLPRVAVLSTESLPLHAYALKNIRLRWGHKGRC